MMPNALPSYLAIDLGASSGRGVVGTFDGDRMAMREVHRFARPLVEDGAHLYWDADALWREIQLALHVALDETPLLRSVSVDSWAVDYQPLDASGRPTRRPYAYRDPRTHGRMNDALSRAGGAAAVYARTGIQLLPFNTLVQIVADLEDEPELVALTATRLLLADYFLYRLSGLAIAERTIASSTQLVDAASGLWAKDLIHTLGDDPARWAPIVAPGTALGPVQRELVPDSVRELPHVIASCSHDTAAAVAAVPAVGAEPWAYISSGTWSLVGAELHAPILTDAARAAGFTNEAGLDGTVRLLTNRTGMWVLEECIREWNAEGDRIGYDALVREASAAASPSRGIDLNAPPFLERGNMSTKIADACAAAQVPEPTSRGALVRLVLESLAQSYARTLDELDAITGRRTEVVHIVGGGAQNALLNQLTANVVGRRVVAGPTEATVLGNLLVQARTMGDLPTGMPIRELARRSSHLVEHSPMSPAREPAPAVSFA
jgi:rhamnulokinase